MTTNSLSCIGDCAISNLYVFFKCSRNFVVHASLEVANTLNVCSGHWAHTKERQNRSFVVANIKKIKTKYKIEYLYIGPPLF